MSVSTGINFDTATSVGAGSALRTLRRPAVARQRMPDAQLLNPHNNMLMRTREQGSANELASARGQPGCGKPYVSDAALPDLGSDGRYVLAHQRQASCHGVRHAFYVAEVTVSIGTVTGRVWRTRQKGAKTSP